MNTPTSDMSSAGTEHDQYDSTKHVAVVGIACRVPGGNNHPEQLWQSLMERQNACSDVPEMRWEPYHRRDPRNPKAIGALASRGYFLDNLEDFDAQFFGISPKEAEQMDPQQRISLEVAWEALENAGIPASTLSGSDAAVFWGVSSDDYSRLVLEDLPNIEPWMGIGTASCGTPNRISYHLNLMGPSSAVDAACASSLVAVHHGVQAIGRGESKLAIVGGGNILCGPGHFCVLERAGALSKEGPCRSFDDEARGFGRGEGAAAIILKNISEAIQDGDQILAVIKGTAVAQDGKTNGIMAPNGLAQQLVARKALSVAEIDPSTVRYVEAHATSTPLGDFTEISALASVYGKGHTSNDPCFVGSIKPNIGHLEAAAGAIGLIKAVMTLNKKLIPPQANLQVLNKRIDWSKSGLKVVQEPTEWPGSDEIRRAAVCSYGYGGTVSHAVLEQFVISKETALSMDKAKQNSRTGPHILLLSAPEKKRISVQARVLQKWMQSSGRQHELAAIASTLAVRRHHHSHRAAIIVDDHDEADRLLRGLSKGLNNSLVTQGQVSNESQSLVWVFSGHGGHWADMGKEMLQDETFYRAIQPLDEVVRSEIELSPIALLQSGEFQSTDQLQILTYVVQIGISAVLQSYGVFPQAVIGHSTGEIAASVVAGALTPEEGAVVVTRRSILYRRLNGQGRMILVNRPFSDVLMELSDSKDLTEAIDCSPSSCVVAGPKDKVAQAAGELKQRGIKAFDVRTDIAFHSPMMDELRDPLISALLGAIKPTIPNRARLYSTSLQDPRGQDLRDAMYWANNMTNPVHLTSAIQAAAEDSYRIFMEVSSHPLVSHSIEETLTHQDISEPCVVSTLVRNKPAKKTLLHAISQLHCYGVAVGWRLQMSKSWAKGLPNTSWVHRRIWRKVETSRFDVVQTHNADSHTLLGRRMDIAATDIVIHTTKLDGTSKPYPQTHPVQGTEIIPAAVYIMTLLKATEGNTLKNVSLIIPIAVETPRSIQVVTQQDKIKILSRLIQDGKAAEDNGPWVTHTTSEWDVRETPPESSMDIPGTIKRIGTRLDDNFSINYLAKVGVTAMGFPWAVTEHYGTSEEMLARVDANPNASQDEPLPWDASSWAPILDAATSVGSTIYFNDPKPRMVAEVKQVDIFTQTHPPRIGWLHVKPAPGKMPSSDVTILDNNGAVLAKLTAMGFAEIEGNLDSKGNMDNLVHQVTWQPAMPAEEPLPIKRVVLVGDDVDLRETWANTIPSRAERILISSPDELASISVPLGEETAIVFLPSGTQSLNDITEVTEKTTWQLLQLLRYLINQKLRAKVFVLTHNTGEGDTPTALGHSPLVGLSRILASEHPDQFGGLIDTEDLAFPLTTIRYIKGVDIIRIRDGVPRVARLRSLPRHKLRPAAQGPGFFVRPDGTYLITGGLGALGLEVAEFLVDNGARRIVLVSRRSLPIRKTWDEPNAFSTTITKIKSLESRGASVYSLSVDMGTPSAAKNLSDALDRLSLPPVRGVIHAAGIVEDQLALDTTKDSFSRVLAPKVAGSLALHEVFPPKSVDFFVLFSSCGQLVGSTGQSSYASANAFLDTLATHRRARGDNSIAFQWTAWREVGMVADSDFVQAEFKIRGVTDVGRDEAFEAWMYAAKYDVDHCVVVRSLPVEEGKAVPSPILKDIAPRYTNSSLPKQNNGLAVTGQGGIQSGEGPKVDMESRIRDCVAQVLHMIPDEVDKKAVLSDLGLDSVMAIHLRRQLQSALGIQMPPTLVWSHPTISHLATWFAGKASA